MTEIRTLDGTPDARLAKLLEEFEREFRYPLGEDRWFRISHGEDYTRFFRAIGESRCFVAEDHGKVIGVVSVARCPLRQPNGNTVQAAYFADLKISSSRRGHTLHGRQHALPRLLHDSIAWARQTPTTPAFSIVMDGTAHDPTSYTGRLGIPTYVELSKLMILRIPCDRFTDQGEAIPTSLTEVRECFRSLTPNHFATEGGNPTLRSLIPASGMILENGVACGILEDTRRCKRLFRDDGDEMISAHLSCFASRSEEDAIRLLKSAAYRCREMGLPAMFVSLPSTKSEAVLELLPKEGIVKAPATVFGFGLPPGKDWSVNTSEI